MLRHRFVLFVVSAGFFWACGGKIASNDGSDDGQTGGHGGSTPTDGTCPAAGAMYCSADDPISADEVTQCKQQLADPHCGADYRAFLACAEQRITCNASDQTDSSSLTNICNDQLQAFESCIGPGPAGSP